MSGLIDQVDQCNQSCIVYSNGYNNDGDIDDVVTKI
jgi:hypothetical protein